MGSNTINVVAGSVKVIFVEELWGFLPVHEHLLHTRDELKKNLKNNLSFLPKKTNSNSFGSTCLEIQPTSRVQKKKMKPHLLDYI